MLEVLFMKKVLLDKKEIYKITNNFRLAILDAKENRRFYFRDRMSNFPSGCCDDASDLLAYFLLEKYCIFTKQGNGVYRDGIPEHTTNHAWLIDEKGTYIDITATQFMFCGAFLSDIYVGKAFEFYNKLEDINIKNNYDITQDERLFKDYKIIMEYMPADLI